MMMTAMESSLAPLEWAGRAAHLPAMHDTPSPGPCRDSHGQLWPRMTLAQLCVAAERVMRRKRRPGSASGDGVPADPRRPDTLSGGAAAALDF